MSQVEERLAAARELARSGRLYPSVILDGGTAAERQAAALALARTVLCEAAPAQRPCGGCRHCRRVGWPGESALFHPDFAVLERDLKTATSAAATKSFARVATVRPFEARAQVFVVANAETFSPEAADALLKLLEEPPAGAPRHFFLLAPSRRDLLPTLRSRSLSLYLGSPEKLDGAVVSRLATAFSGALEGWLRGGAVVHLLAAAGVLATAGGFEDPRATRGFAHAAAAVRKVAAERPELAPQLLALAESLLAAGDLRLRAISAERIFEGLVVRHLVRGRASGMVSPPLVLR
jgi:hypothetical protein